MPSGVPSDTVVAAERDTDAGVAAPPPRVRDRPHRHHLRLDRFEAGLAVIAAAGLALRVGYILQTASDRSLCQRLACGDARYYLNQAATIAAGHGFVSPDLSQPTADHPPLTALVLALVRTVVAGDAAVVGSRLLMAVVGTGTVVAIGFLARRVGRGGRADAVGLVAAAIAAINANLWMNDVVPMSEALAALAVTVTLLAVYRFLDAPDPRRAAVVGALVGLAGLVRAELLLLGPITFVPMALAVKAQPWRDRVIRVAVAGAVALAVLVPWTAYNLGRFQEPVLLSTNDGLTLAGANCDQMYGLTDEGGIGFWNLGCALVHDRTFPTGIDDSVKSRLYRDIGLDYVGDHLSRLQVVIEHRLLRGWGLFAPDQMVFLNTSEGRAPWASWLGFVQWWLLLVPAVVGVRVLHRRRQPVWPLVSTAVIVSLVLAAFYGIVRFRLPADVAATVLAAVAFDVLARRVTDRRWRGLVARLEPALEGSNGHHPAPTPAATTAAPAPPGPDPAATGDLLLPDVEPVPASAERRADGRFPCLDAYRGMGMIMVLLNHAAYTTGFQMREGGAASVLTPIIARLDMSVPMFFVLSGFLLFRPYARALLTERSLPPARLFYRRRMLRILPAYWVALVGGAVLLGLNLPDVWSWLGNATLAPAFGVPLQKCEPDGSCHVAYALTPAWSIGVEAAFYLSLPLFVLALHRLVRRRPVAHRLRLMAGALAALYLAGTALRVYVVLAGPSWAEQSLLWLPMFFDVFAVGMALALVSAAHANGRPLPRLATWAGDHPVICWAVAGAIFAVMTLLPYPERPFGLRDANGFSDYILRQFVYGVAAAAWLAPAMFGDQTKGRLRALLSSRPMVYLGAISLSFYLWHLPLAEKIKQLTVPDWEQRAAAAANPDPANPLASVAIFTGSYPRVVLLTVVVSLIVAGLLYRYVELPFLRLKDAPLRDLWRRRRPETEAEVP